MHKSLRKDLPVIIILFVLSLAIQLYFLNPPILSDQMEYYITAVRFPRLPSNPNIGSMRIGLELPVAVLYRIFGSAEVSYYTVPLLSFALLSISVYFIGKNLFSKQVGVFSALWVLLIPNLLQESGHLLPDVPATACATAAFALLFTFFSGKQIKQDLSSRSAKFILILAGLLFGWSYLVKEYLAILFFLIPMVFWMMDVPYRKMIPVAIAMLAMFGLEVLTGIIYYNNPLVRFLAANPRETEGGIHKDVIRIMVFFGRLLNKSGGEGFLVIMLAGLGNSIYESIRKNKSYLFLLSWILLIYLLFTFAGLLPVIFDWEEIVLMRLHKFRYWIPILPPLVIAGVACLEKAFTFISGKFKQSKIISRTFIQSAMAIILCLVSIRALSVIKDDSDFIKNGNDHYLELRQFLKENDDQIDLIWIDRDNKRSFERILPMYIRNPFGKLIWHGQTKYINTGSLYLRADEIIDGFIIIDRDFMVPEFNDVPDYLADYPENWELVFESENKKLALYSVN